MAVIEERSATANRIRLHYLMAGQGDPVILLHGYAETSHMWRPLIVELAKTWTVIAPDLRGFGQSDKPEGGYDKKTMAGCPRSRRVVNGGGRRAGDSANFDIPSGISR